MAFIAGRTRAGRFTAVVAVMTLATAMLGACEHSGGRPPAATSTPAPSSTMSTPAPSSVTAEGVRVYRNLHYRTPDGPERVDVYVPPKAKQHAPYPGIVFVHGGGWQGGSPALLADAAVAAAEHGYVGFNIEYSLEPPRAPRQVRDVQAAIRQARAHAATFHLDPDRLAGWGGSAGAHLVTQAAITHNAETHLRAVVGWSGPYDLAHGLDNPDPRAARVLNVYLGCEDISSDACRREAAAASPALHTHPDDPPALLVNSTDEIVPAAQMRELAENLRAAGVPVETVLLPGSRHAARGYGDEVTARTLRFLDAHLGTN